MFLSRRTTHAEYFDSPECSSDEIRNAYRQLGRVNHLFKFAHPFEFHLPRLLGEERCGRLRLLDLGAGDGSLGRHLERWAQARGWIWRVTDLDLKLALLGPDNNNRRVAATALRLPFRDESFNVVLSCQMAHHLSSDPEIVQHFREAWRVARDALFLSDLHRNVGLYALVWFGTLATGCSKRLRADGLLSVARGFRLADWEAFAREADIREPKISVYLGTRILLRARKCRA